MINKKIAVTFMALAISSFAAAAEFKVGEDYILTGAAAASHSEKVSVTEYFGYWCPHCNNFEPVLEKWLEKNADKVAFDRVPVAFSTRGQNQTLAQKAYFVGKQVKSEKAVDSTMFDFYHKYGRIAPSFRDLEKIKADPIACNIEITKLVDRAEKQSAQANRPFDIASVTKYLTDNVCETDNRGWSLLKLGKEARGNIRNVDILKQIISIAGVNTDKFEKRLNSFSMDREIKNAGIKAETMGIDSVPMIVVNDKYRVSSAKGFKHMLSVVEFLVEKEAGN